MLCFSSRTSQPFQRRLYRTLNSHSLVYLKPRRSSFVFHFSSATQGDDKDHKGEGRNKEKGKSNSGGFWKWYNECLDSQPLLTKMITSGIIVSGGDVFCQYVIEKAEHADWARVARMGTTGATLIAGSLHLWYGFLFRNFTRQGVAGAIQRMALDQIFFAPVFLPSFFTFLFTLEGHPEKIAPHLKEHFWEALKNNWCLWTPAQFVNFLIIPPKFQVLFTNFVAFAWNTYLSYNAHNHHKENIINV